MTSSSLYHHVSIHTIKTYCKQCTAPIYTPNKQFCNTSCAAKYNNSKKDYTKIKTGPNKQLKPKENKPPFTKIYLCTCKVSGKQWYSPTVKTIHHLAKRIKHKKIVKTDMFTKIYLCTCKVSGKQWYSPTVKTIHPSIIDTITQYRYQCRFTFSLSQYPEWFNYASDLIKQYGWYSASNKNNNLSGCSRDHLYSVHDGFLNKIDPLILNHPANCEIIPHKINQSKHKSSKITLNELMLRIDEFNQRYER
jgi:hypothetical protein